jgi:tetratricopeptide (TPR) repeat protein
MKHASVAAIVAALTFALTPCAAASQRAKGGATVATLRAFQAWVEAVRTHAPGVNDAAVQAASNLPLDTRTELDGQMRFFLAVLFSNPYDTNNNVVLRMLADLARLARGNPDAPTFIRRAVLLHTDAAIFGDRYEQSEAPPQNNEPPSRIRVDPQTGLTTNLDDQSRIHPLLARRIVYLDKDGQVLGNSVASFNWPFARWLIDYLLKELPFGVGPCHGPECAGWQVASATTNQFVGVWYHATTAFMFQNGFYAEVTTHIQRAGEILPDDPRILFDRACYSESLGLPLHQVLVPEENDAERALHQHSATGWRPSTENRATMGIPKTEVTNNAAEQLFRRALKNDPSYIEARVRLGRLLTVRKRYEEALNELTTVLSQKPDDPIVAYYAHLFAGRAARGLGRGDEAARHYRDASALFPDAQSPRLGLSEVELLSANVDAALEPIQKLGGESVRLTADPWWDYHLASGREADHLMAGVWAMLPAQTR